MSPEEGRALRGADARRDTDFMRGVGKKKKTLENLRQRWMKLYIKLKTDGLNRFK